VLDDAIECGIDAIVASRARFPCHQPNPTPFCFIIRGHPDKTLERRLTKTSSTQKVNLCTSKSLEIFAAHVLNPALLYSHL
jgi:hypothetical protein